MNQNAADAIVDGYTVVAHWRREYVSEWCGAVLRSIEIDLVHKQ